MADFTEAHDQLIATIGPPTNFSDEKISSGIYHFLLLNCLILFISSYLIPWNLVFLLSGWFIISLLHPKVQQYLLSSSDSEFANREKRKAIDRFKTWVDRDIILDELPEVREVEIFELQRHYSAGSEWEPWIYSASPYEPLSPQRIAGHRPRGTRFFEDVKSPGGWEFKDSKWTLDLGSRTWVSERCVNGVEVEEEKERWVYDWIEGRQEHDSEGEEGREWEEGHEGGREEVSKARGRRGEWRRRRWVRAVVRKRYLKGE